jgi:hypothetical protein
MAFINEATKELAKQLKSAERPKKSTPFVFEGFLKGIYFPVSDLVRGQSRGILRPPSPLMSDDLRLDIELFCRPLSPMPAA